MVDILLIKPFIILAVLYQISLLRVGEAYLRVISRAGNKASFEETSLLWASCWQHCGRPEIWTSDLPLQRRMR